MCDFWHLYIRLHCILDGISSSFFSRIIHFHEKFDNETRKWCARRKRCFIYYKWKRMVLENVITCQPSKSIGPSHIYGTHYSDVIMSVMTSQITGVLIICSTVCSGTDQRKHQSSASRARNAENVSIWWRHHAQSGHHCTNRCPSTSTDIFPT